MKNAVRTVTSRGAPIPTLGFGVFRMSEAEVERVVPAALDAGFPNAMAETIAIVDFELTNADMAAIDTLARPDGRLVSPPGLAPVWDL